MRPISGEKVRALTLAVGRDFDWPSQGWSDERWSDFLASSSLRHWAGELGGETIGLLSLNVELVPDIEIDSFGLVPGRIGQGLGGHFLTAALHLAWALQAERIWLHTSSDDHPNALENYLARGFREFPSDQSSCSSGNPIEWP